MKMRNIYFITSTGRAAKEGAFLAGGGAEDVPPTDGKESLEKNEAMNSGN